MGLRRWMLIHIYLILVEKHLRKIIKDQVNEMGSIDTVSTGSTVKFRGGIYSLRC